MHDFSDKVAVITGAARGLGAAYARALAEKGAGVAVLLRWDEDPLTLVSIDDARDGADRNMRGGGESTVLRTHGVGAQILRDLGVTRMRVLSAPRQMHGLSGFGLEVIEYVDCESDDHG